jgi:tetratricopeptide (TPR) repeat protein
MISQRKKIFALCFSIALCVCLLLNLSIPGGVSALNSNLLHQKTPLYSDLGNYHHPITTSSADAGRYFDQGLTLIYGFNHAEARRSFQEAVKQDPNCAMCYWGIALSFGPHVNAPMDETVVSQAYQALEKARQLAPQASPVEQAYIEALSKRYAEKPVQDRSPLDLAYANAMRTLSQNYPDDLDAATLFAESLMDLMPWSYWTPEGKPKPETVEVIATLESVMERDPNHPGANHYYIHAMEASSTPDKAEAAADRLLNFAPGSGHLVHMPSHIYLRVGRYHDAAMANEKAIVADQTYLARSQESGFYRALYYPHNIHFLWQVASIEGRSQVAITNARNLASKVSPALVKEVPMTEMFLSVPFVTLVQFQQWDDILTEPQPAQEFSYTVAMWHYARGMAWAAKGNLAEAQNEQQQLQSFWKNEKIMQMEAMGVPLQRLVEIAHQVLSAQVAGLQNQDSEMIASLQTAVKTEDGLPYMEPPYWYQPVREFLGASLLKLNQASEAEAIYRQNLQQHPKSGWSLSGLAISLRMQGKTEEAAQVQQQFEQAWSKADISLN